MDGSGARRSEEPFASPTLKRRQDSDDASEKSPAVTIMRRPATVPPKIPVGDTATDPETVVVQRNSQSPVAGKSNAQAQPTAQPSDKHQNRPASAASTCDSQLQLMKASVRLFAAEGDSLESILDFLCNHNTNFTVICAIGPQGSGKSTLLSMIAGNDHQDMYRHYVFRPASREAVELSRHQTFHLSCYVTKSRMILIDCQGLSSASIFEDFMAHGYRSHSFKVDRLVDYTAECLQTTSTLLQVCHTVLLCVDSFIDIDIIRHLRTAEMLRSPPSNFLSETVQLKANREVNIVVVHQRAKMEDFEPRQVKLRSAILRSMFADSKLCIEGGLSMAEFVGICYTEIEPKVNYLVVPEMKLRTRAETNQSQPTEISPIRSPITDFETIIRALRANLHKLPRCAFLKNDEKITEAQW